MTSSGSEILSTTSAAAEPSIRSAPTLKIWTTPLRIRGDAREVGATEDRALRRASSQKSFRVSDVLLPIHRSGQALVIHRHALPT